MDDIDVRELPDTEVEYLTPIPRKPGESITMDFPDAIKEIMDNHKVRRMTWPDEDYALIKGDWLTIHTKNEFFTWSISKGDMDGHDWIVVEELDETN